MSEVEEYVKDSVWDELLNCYGQGEDTDWPYLTDLHAVIMGLIKRYGPAFSDDTP